MSGNDVYEEDVGRKKVSGKKAAPNFYLDDDLVVEVDPKNPPAHASAAPPLKEISVGITNPQHYAKAGLIETIDTFRSVAANISCAQRYLSRLGDKGGDNTETRDAKAAIWYTLDLMALLLTEDDGAFVPTIKDFYDIDGKVFSLKVLQFAKSVEDELELSFTSRTSMKGCVRRGWRKRFVLAAMMRVQRTYNNSVRLGMDDYHYREFVLSVLMTCVHIIEYAVVAGRVKDRFVEIYKGSTSAPLSEETFDLVESTIVVFRRLGLISAASDMLWGNEDDVDDDDCYEQ